MFNWKWLYGQCVTYWNFVAKGATGELDLLEHFNKIDIITFLLGRKIFRKSDLALAEERKSDIESYVKTLIKLPPKISQSSVLVSFFQRRGTDPERFHQFPQRINRLSRDEETCNSFTDVSSTQEGKNTPRVNDCLNTNPAKEDYAQVSYTNLTFEASGSMERERPLKS